LRRPIETAALTRIWRWLTHLLMTFRSPVIIAGMRFLRFSVLLLLTATSATAATLSGTVRDSEGAVIPNARIIVHWDSLAVPTI
jgi:hypothetical protein